ncbi:stage V sporulation protein AC [Senegalia massiliensis]|uniref:Stage V sporulation protein AC n=1 Tax=Senegalia massiliensis TaxID=1720316 RepID=A0A845QWT4_9CLOT|nr:stage V sporulation protein AC [Senegalia massiliensis]NBI06965.1 stage V sporulation protein AC [Senegalia massiliensis]
MKNMNSEEYSKYVEKKVPKPSYLRNCIRAFWVGGLICTLGQVFLNYYTYIGLDKKEVASAVPMTLVFLSALFTGIGLYDRLGRYAGAGSIVPITGFANSIVSPAMEYKREGYVFGVAAKMFVIAGPVLVYGYGSSIIYGIIYYLANR